MASVMRLDEFFRDRQKIRVKQKQPHLDIPLWDDDIDQWWLRLDDWRAGKTLNGKLNEVAANHAANS